MQLNDNQKEKVSNIIDLTLEQIEKSLKDSEKISLSLIEALSVLVNLDK